MSDGEFPALLNELRRQNNWLKFQNREEVQEYLAALDEDDQLIFHHTNGKNSIREVATKTGYGSHTPIQNRMKEWRALGLIFKNEDGKWEHLAPMDAFGLEPPEPKEDDDNDE